MILKDMCRLFIYNILVLYNYSEFAPFSVKFANEDEVDEHGEPRSCGL